MVEDGKFRVEKFNPKLPVIEYIDGKLFISEGSIPTIGWTNKEVDDHEGRRMRGSWLKGTSNDTTEPDNIDGFQYFKRKDNKGDYEHIG